MKTGVIYLGIRDPYRIREDMENLASSGYTHVLHPYSEEDFQNYRKSMREIIHISAECGLTVYVSPWGIGKVFDGLGLSELAGVTPKLAQIDSRGSVTPAACPNNLAYREYMRDWVEEVCSTQIETVLWDNPHFYQKVESKLWCCRCDSCQKQFRKQTRHFMPNSQTKSVRQFLRASLYEFLAELTGLVHRYHKRNSICFDAVIEEETNEILENIAELPSVDELGLKPAWQRGEKPSNISQNYHQISKRLLAVTKKFEKEPQVWIKNYNIQKNNEQAVAEATFAAYNEGVRNLFAFGYKGSHAISIIRSDEPELVWKVQTDAFSECHDKAILNVMIDTLRAQNPVLE